jgi:hypothetical protein
MMMTVDYGNVINKKTKIRYDAQQSITPLPSLLMLVKAVDVVLSPPPPTTTTKNGDQKQPTEQYLPDRATHSRRPTPLPRTTTKVPARRPILMNHVQYKKRYDDNSATSISSCPFMEHHQYQYGDQVKAIEKETQKKRGRLPPSASTSNSGLLAEIVSPLVAPPPLLSGLRPGEIRA